MNDISMPTTVSMTCSDMQVVNLSRLPVGGDIRRGRPGPGRWKHPIGPGVETLENENTFLVWQDWSWSLHQLPCCFRSDEYCMTRHDSFLYFKSSWRRELAQQSSTS
jgi:hypothetical protein